MLLLKCFSSLVIYFSKLIFKVGFFIKCLFPFVLTFNIFPIQMHMDLFFGVFRIHRSLSSADVAHASVVTQSQAHRRAIADYANAAPSQPAARPRQSFLPAGAIASTWGPPAVHVSVGPPAKRRRFDCTTSQFAASDVASGDSFHTSISAPILYASRRSLSSVG